MIDELVTRPLEHVKQAMVCSVLVLSSNILFTQTLRRTVLPRDPSPKSFLPQTNNIQTRNTIFGGRWVRCMVVSRYICVTYPCSYVSLLPAGGETVRYIWY